MNGAFHGLPPLKTRLASTVARPQGGFKRKEKDSRRSVPGGCGLCADHCRNAPATRSPSTGGSMASRASVATGGVAEYSIWRVILASAVGTMIEWYDFYIFGSLTAVLALKFYPDRKSTR